MSDYLGAIVALLGLVNIIIKYLFSDEAKITVKKRELDAQMEREEDALNKEVSEQAALTEGAGKAWDALDDDDITKEGKDPKGS